MIDEVNISAQKSAYSIEAKITDAEFQFYDQINEKMRELNINRKDLAKKMGMPEKNLRDMFKGCGTMIRSMVLIAKGLDCTLRMGVEDVGLDGTKNRAKIIGEIYNMLVTEKERLEFLEELEVCMKQRKNGEVNKEYVDNFLSEWYATAEVLTIPGAKETMLKYKNEPPKIKRDGKTWEDQCREMGIDLK